MRGIKLLVSDVDGTLVTEDKALTAGACRAVDRLRAAGIELGDHQRFTMPFLFGASVLMTLACVALGIVCV